MSQIASEHLLTFSTDLGKKLSPSYLYTMRVWILCCWEYTSVLFMDEHLSRSWAKSSASRAAVSSPGGVQPFNFSRVGCFSVCCHLRSVLPLSRQTELLSLVCCGEGTYEGRLTLV